MLSLSKGVFMSGRAESARDAQVVVVVPSPGSADHPAPTISAGIPQVPEPAAQGVHRAGSGMQNTHSGAGAPPPSGPLSVGRGAPAVVLQNRAFVELSRIIASGEPAVLSSALPLVVRGAGVPSAAIFGLSRDEVVLVAAQGVPLKLRAYLEEPGFSGAPDFLGRRALAHRHALIDTDVFGSARTPGASTAMEEAAWQSCIAVPIRVSGAALAVILAGARTGAASADTVSFLEAAANLIGAALAKPSAASPAQKQTPLPCAGCVGSVLESLSGLGRAMAAEQELLREVCFREGAPAESDALLGRSRAMERAFRRLSEVALRLPARGCSHGKRRSFMASVVDSAVQSARPALAASRVELEVVCAPACDFEGDPEMVALAVRHLVANAAESFAGREVPDALPSSRRCVRVCARQEGGCATVHVEDSGPGIPFDLRPRVFEPGVSTKGPCRGLGLAVARHVAESHDGWMEVGVSELGGTKVSLHLPVRSAALDEMRSAATLPQIPAMGGGAKRPQRGT